MGTSVWSFLRPQTGELCPVARGALEDFLYNAGRLRADGDGFVRCAEVFVNLRNRRAVEVMRVGFFQYRALDDGRLDREHFREIMAAAPEAAFGWLRLSKPPPGRAAHQIRRKPDVRLARGNSRA